MAADISKSVFRTLLGNKRARLLPTLAIALIVTGLVGGPLVYRAIDARNNPGFGAANAGQVQVDTAGGTVGPLDESTVAGTIVVSYHDDEAQGVAFNLFASGDDAPLIASRDLVGPTFDLVLNERGTGAPLDSTMLENGEYELFLTVTTTDGDERTAVTFTVANS